MDKLTTAQIVQGIQESAINIEVIRIMKMIHTNSFEDVTAMGKVKFLREDCILERIKDFYGIDYDFLGEI